MRESNVAILGRGRSVERLAFHLGRTIGKHGYIVSIFESPSSLVDRLHDLDVRALVLVPGTMAGDMPDHLPLLVHRMRPQTHLVLVAEDPARETVSGLDGSPLLRITSSLADAGSTVEEILTRDGRVPRPRAIPDNILVTGGLGFLGKALVRRLLSATTARLWLLVRPKEGMPARERAERAFPGVPAERLRVLEGDLVPRAGEEGPSFGSDLGLECANDREALQELLERCNGVLHVGAYLSFLDKEDEKQRLFDINVGGTIRLLSLVRRFRRPLVSFDYVSTAFVHGTLAAPAILGEDDLRPTGWCNFYEQSKWIGENIVRSSGLPWRIYRPPIICEDPNSDDPSAETIYGIIDVVAAAVAKEHRRGNAKLAVRIPTHVGTLTNFIYRDDLARMIVDIVCTGDGFGRVYNTVNPERTIGAHFWQALADRFGFEWEAHPTVPRRSRNLVEALFYRVIVPRYEGYLYRSFPHPSQENLRRLLGRSYPESTVCRIDEEEMWDIVDHHLRIGEHRCERSA